MATDILFVHPGQSEKIYQDLSKEFTAIDIPVWTCLIADFIRRKGFDCAIHDVNVQGWDDAVMRNILDHYNPKLVVMMVYGHHPSASTQTMPVAHKIVCDIKAYNQDLPVAMGGTHASALPEQTLSEEKVDYLIQGEGPLTIEGLIRYQKGKCELNDIPGLWYRENGVPACSGRASVLQHLDEELRGYAWDLLPDLSLYRAHNWHCFQYFEESQDSVFADVRSPYISLYTSLGCPYSCNYCCINATFGKPGIRYWSVETVVGWIDTLVSQYGIKNIRFADELFVLSPKRVEHFCDLMIERAYDLNIWAYGRVDTIRDQLLAKMKKAGINWLCLGIESGNTHVRENVNKTIRKDIRKIVRQIQAHGIYIIGNYMFGLPEDSEETMQETLDLAMELNCAFVNFYAVMAYPGSQLYQNAFASGLIPEKWGSYSQHSFDTQPLPTRYLTPAEVLKFRDDAFECYYQNEKYLNTIEHHFGGKARQHIDKMLTIKIKRRLTSPASATERNIACSHSKGR